MNIFGLSKNFAQCKKRKSDVEKPMNSLNLQMFKNKPQYDTIIARENKLRPKLTYNTRLLTHY